MDESISWMMHALERREQRQMMPAQRSAGNVSPIVTKERSTELRTAQMGPDDGAAALPVLGLRKLHDQIDRLDGYVASFAAALLFLSADAGFLGSDETIGVSEDMLAAVGRRLDTARRSLID